MRSRKASHTAQFVAFNRALGSLAPTVPGFSDPLAIDCLPERWQKKVHATARALAAHRRASPFSFWMRGMGVINQFRTVVLDRALLAACPVQQLIILGAGLDTRAWRLEALAGATVFEVDHPATQALKQSCAAAWPRREVRFAPTDFQHDDLARVLEGAGYNRALPAFWLWEGVTLYLRPESVSANLKTMAALSAPGSRLALTYLNKDRGRTPRSLFLALMGEPIRSAYSPTEMAEAARACGWRIVSDTGIEDWLRELTPALRPDAPPGWLAAEKPV